MQTPTAITSFDQVFLEGTHLFAIITGNDDVGPLILHKVKKK